MDIQVAQHAGACYGVKRALDLALQAAQQHDQVATLGALIHNPRVIAQMQQQGVDMVASPEEAPSGSCLIIRSHGVAPHVVEEAKARGLEVVDATCPHVKIAQQAAQIFYEQGRLPIVVGETGHPEVEAICAYAHNTALVVQSPKHLPAELPYNVGLLAQTTQTQEAFEEVAAALENRGCDVARENTICSATRLRQEAARKLACQADCMLVLGGKNSGNTTRLAEICAVCCPHTYHIEGADEVDDAWLEGIHLVGIAAGASTPQEHIDALVASLRKQNQAVGLPEQPASR